MSIGNLKSEGNKGNNFPFQLKVLQGLSNLLTTNTGAERTPGIIRTTSTGNVNTVAATFYSVSVAKVGLADGTVLGATIKPGEVLNFSADALNNFFTSFVYDATGTEFVIIFVY